jgi:hypothetical protein
MNPIESPFAWLIGLPAIGLALFLLRRHFSAEARERRRRDRSHRRVVSSKQGPTVKLAANSGKPKGNRKK